MKEEEDTMREEEGIMKEAEDTMREEEEITMELEEEAEVILKSIKKKIFRSSRSE
eukprot:CAMPEP_0202955862 /NCGR_PEP_ID=MMETSP1396-20130829/368_1 /ASSEMBLY_ACC=CAM_ASM_000872 /TAXON_ID= /ORGANISM="Pseudokeronopsis sp., Strain Brazil" /LENGTH=54 /DNA_ID=CAMNT_0049672593 /DNA_START=93 /DNA_END=257 /DNA_ORIENTATION=+